MITVCLPIYHSDVRPLVLGLHAQAAHSQEVIELLLIDDASAPPWQALNAELASLPHLRYQELPHNVGRARIRNLLAQAASQPYLLFIDSDMSLLGDDFLAQYVAVAQQGHAVACGGHVYDPQVPARQRRLHWRYGMRRETPPLQQRQQQPHQAFKTSNFLIQRDLMRRLGFDERLRHYGHEDTLFGFRLAEAQIPIHHLDNPLRHDDVETNVVFVQKTEQGLRNLVHIQQTFDLPPAFADSMLLLRMAQRLQRWRLQGLVSLAFGLGQGLWRRWLHSGYASVTSFNLYKLGCYLRSFSQSQGNRAA
jgi:glycosyltransferase involved in cell wall biosynthesis